MKFLFENEFEDDSKKARPVFKESDMAQAHFEGQQQGFAEGLQLAEQGILAQIRDILPSINSSITEVRELGERKRTQMFGDCLEFSKAVAMKVALGEAQKAAIEQIVISLHDSLAFLEKEQNLTLYVHANLVEKMTEELKSLPDYNQSAWTISGDDALGELDFTLRWEDGEMIRAFEKISGKIESIAEINKEKLEKENEHIDSVIETNTFNDGVQSN